MSLGLALMAVSTAEAQQTGALSGVVRDAQGGVLPGVTVNVTGEGGAARSTVSTEDGLYSLTGLPPGAYVVAFELTGFTTQTRDGVVVQVNRTTRLDMELGVGGLQETITVSGETPVVDVSSTVTQTNITKDLYESIPTGRNPWVMAGLVPGVVTGRLDVGGTEGMQQYNLEAFGSADSQKSFSIDGLKTNWAGGSGGATMQYYGFEMYEEYNMQTASGTAESDVSGVYMNMVTKSGGNRFTSDHNFYFMNDSLQGTNVDDDLRTRLGLTAGGQTGAAGNPIDISYDWSSTLGRPDRAATSCGSSAPRGAGASTSSRSAPPTPTARRPSTTTGSRTTWARSPGRRPASTRASFMFNRNLKYRFHRRDSPYLFVEDLATTLQDQPAQNFVAQVNQVVGQKGVFDARFGRMWGDFPSRYQDGATEIALRDTVRNTRINAAEIQSINPNHRYQANGNYSYFVPQHARRHARLQGRRAAVVGADGVRPPPQRRHPARDARRRAVPGADCQHADRLGPQDGDLGRVHPGSLGDRPRHDQRSACASTAPPATCPSSRARPAPTSARASFPQTDIYDFSMNVGPRLGISYDVFGNGQTAIKAYFGRFYNQFGSEIVEATNLNALATQNVAWTDTNGNLRLDAGELGPVPAFARGLFPTFDQDADRPYSDEINVGVEHQLMQNLAVGVSYHRRQHRNGLGLIDTARPAEAYTPEARTFTDPVSGQARVRSRSTSCCRSTARCRTASSPTSTCSRATTTA